jgi:hypothetical protein
MWWPGMPSGGEEGEITSIVVINFRVRGKSLQGNGGRDDGTRFEGSARPVTPQTEE